MNANLSKEDAADGIKIFGTVLSFLAATAMGGVILFAFVLLVDISSNGIPNGALTEMGRSMAPFAEFFALTALASELLGFGVIVVGTARWRYRIIHSPRWVVSATVTILATVMTLIMIVLYVLVTTAYV